MGDGLTVFKLGLVNGILLDIIQILLELRNLATVSELVIRCAMQRKESRGLHYTLDYPDLSPIARDTVMVPINFAGQDVIIHRDQV